VSRLLQELRNETLSEWQKTHEQIDQTIRLYDRLLLILSEHRRCVVSCDRSQAFIHDLRRHAPRNRQEI
jgi:hypothetical protein